LKSSMRSLHQNIHIETGVGIGISPRDRLKLFIHSLLRHIQDSDPSPNYIKLLLREVTEKKQALDIVIMEVIRPACMELESIVHSLGGTAAPERQVRLICASVVSQCISYCHCRSLMARLYPDQPYEPDDDQEFASSVIWFTFCAIKGIAQGRHAKIE
jgi:hypothetical protein